MMMDKLDSSNHISLTRRKILGGLFVGAGAVLSGLHMPALGQRMKQKGKYLLDGFSSIPRGLETAVSMPLIEALHGRRARRFALGAEIPDGPLKFKSKHAPMPLSELEQMMVLTAAAGNTGWFYLHPFNPNYVPNIPNYASAAGGRTFPSAAGFHTTDFFYTDDNGTYFLPTRDAHSLIERDKDGAVDLNAYLKAHRSRIKKLSDKRMHIPPKPAHIEMHNPWCVNVPGSTLIIPVADLAQHHVAALCYLVQNGACIFDDVNKNPIPGIEKFSSLVDVKNPYPLTYVEQLSLAEVTAELSTACYAGALMLQAMGLGGWMFDGITPMSVLGASGDPEMPGLGFRYDTDERWPLPNITGLPGVFEGFCPPHYKDMRAAVEAFIKRKFGADGPFNPNTPGPYRENARVRGAGKVHSEEFKECVTTMAQYVFDRFGKFPGTVPSIFILTYLQAHHLDLEFYDKHFTAGAYLETHARHQELWHQS
jgi:hypothetical protein